jgi:hypothetical protein
MVPIARITSFTSLISFIIGLPTVIATYYQALKAREEASEARQENIIHSENCLEFIYDEDGSCINLVPLETLHSLPKPGDIVLLPGDGTGVEGMFHTGAFKIQRIEHIYARVNVHTVRPQEARLTKTVAHVVPLNEGVKNEDYVET